MTELEAQDRTLQSRRDALQAADRMLVQAVGAITGTAG
jgi:hypothetical protein